MIPRIIVLLIVLYLIIAYTPIGQCFGALVLFWLLSLCKGALKEGRD